MMLRVLANDEGLGVGELLEQSKSEGTSSQKAPSEKTAPESCQPPAQDETLSDSNRGPGQQQPLPEKALKHNLWNSEGTASAQPSMGTTPRIANSFPASQGPFPGQPQPSVKNDNSKTSEQYRHRRIDRVSNLLVNRYRRIINETNSALLVDTHTGDVLPEMVNAIAAPLATDYRMAHKSEVSKADIKRAFDHFGQLFDPATAQTFFGRAGYDPGSRQRYIDAGPGNCLTFDYGVSFYRSVIAQPCIRPTQSLRLPDPTSIGNWHPGLVSSLFDHTVLSRESDLLLIAWMILSWMPDRKLVMLELLGSPSASLEQAHSLIKRVLDPGTVNLLNELPGRIETFNKLVLKHYLLSFNQIDELTPTVQKNLFSLMRGKSVQWQWEGKKLDASIAVQCPVMINSMESVVTEPKLADATLSIEVEESSDHYPLSEQVPSMEPAILAGLLMIFGQVNQRWQAVEYDKRFDQNGGLADLCRVGEIVAESLGREKAEFWKQFWNNQQSRREFELEESPVALAVKRMLDDDPSADIELPVKEWLVRLEDYRPKRVSSDSWPTHSRGLGAKFKEIQSLLRDLGITLTSRGRRGPLRYWRAQITSSSSAVLGRPDHPGS